MKKFNQESYIQSVLRHVRFKEAHREIGHELASHIAEMKESYSGIINDERQLQDQITKRMGDPEAIGQHLDQIHRPRIDWAIIILAAGVNLPFVSYGGSMMISQLAMIGIALGYYRRKNIGNEI